MLAIPNHLLGHRNGFKKDLLLNSLMDLCEAGWSVVTCIFLFALLAVGCDVCLSYP